MKKFFMALAMCIATIGFTSCGKDSENLIVGKWVLDKRVYDFVYDSDGDHLYNVVYDGYNIIYNFYEDGTCDEGGLFSGTWSISEDTLFCSLWGTKNHIILELTSSDMVLHTVEYGWEKCYASYFRRK